MVVSDALLSGLSQASVLAALQALFNVSASDFLEHPLCRGAAHVGQFPDHSRHALVIALCEQGVRLSAAILAWLRPLSMIGTETFDIAQIWGSQPKHELRIVALLSVETTPELGLESTLIAREYVGNGFISSETLCPRCLSGPGQASHVCFVC